MDQRYKEYLKKQGKVDSVCIWAGSDVRAVQILGAFLRAFFLTRSEQSVCACDPWLLHARAQNHRRVWVGKDPKADLQLISFHLLLWALWVAPSTHCWVMSNFLDPQALLLWAVPLHGAALTQVQQLSLGLDLHKAHMGQHLQPDQVPLSGRGVTQALFACPGGEGTVCLGKKDLGDLMGHGCEQAVWPAQ